MPALPQDFQLCGLQVLASLARGALDRDLIARVAPMPLLEAVISLACAGTGARGSMDSEPGARSDRGDERLRCACLQALSALAYDSANRRAMLASGKLMALLSELVALAPTPLASAPASPGPPTSPSPLQPGQPTGSRRPLDSPPPRDAAAGTLVTGVPAEAVPAGDDQASPPGGVPSVARVASDVTGQAAPRGALLAELAQRAGGTAGGRRGGRTAVDETGASSDPRLQALRLLAVLGA